MKFVCTYTKYVNNKLTAFVKTIDAISWDDAEYQVSLDPCLELVGVLVEEIDEDSGEITSHENLN